MAEEPKPNFGKYQVQGVLGEGGMGRVWKAYDPDLEVTVAIKELKEQFRDQANLERFFREAQIAAKCRHQNIVLITDLSKVPPYFVMEFLEARELSTFVHKGRPITLAQLVKILSQVCDGLGFLHSRGIFHRDLKPANIMLLKDDMVKVTDFGISKAPFGQATMTQVIMGTIPYMSPEQITTPSKVDGRSDLWALGVITYELTQRKHPFPGEGDINTIFHIVHSPPAAFGALPPTVEESVQKLLTKALQKNPEDRIRSTEEYKVMLQGLLRGVPDPDSIIFPFQEAAATSTKTSIITEEEVLKAIASRAFVLVEEIEGVKAEKRALLAKKVYDNAAEVARMARVLVAEKNVLGLESVLKDLEAQKTLLDAGAREGIVRVRGEAEAHAKAGRFQEAAAAWAQLLAFDPGDAIARVGAEQARKGIEKSRREAAEAQRDAQQRLEAAHEIAAHLERARAAVRDRKPQEIQIYAQKILALDPRHEEAKRLLADAGSIQGTIELASLMRNEGRQHLKSGDYERARQSWSTVLEVEPGDAEAAEALKKIDAALAAQKKRQSGLQKAAEAEAALKGQEYEKALSLYKEAETLAPGEAAVRQGNEAARRGLDSLRAAEKEAAVLEKSGDLAGATRSWEAVIALQRSHATAPRELERIRGLLRAQEEKRRAEENRRLAEEERLRLDAEQKRRAEAERLRLEADQKRRAEEERRRAAEEKERTEAERLRQIAARQKEVTSHLESLGEEMGAARESLDERLLAAIKDVVGHARKAAAGSDLKAIEAALAEIESARKGVKDGVQRAVDAALKTIAPSMAIVRDIPDEDVDALGGTIVAKGRDALARLDAAHQQGDLREIRERAKTLPAIAQEIALKRDALVQKGAAAIREAAAALEAVLKQNEKGLKDAIVHKARETMAKAAKDSAGPRIKLLGMHVEALKAIREGILREIQETLRGMKEQAQKGRGQLEAAVTKNRRAVAKNPDLAKKVDAMMREAAGAGSIESAEQLGRIVRDLDALRAQVPLDPLRFLPHALASAGVIAAVAGFLVWRHVQATTAYDFALRVTPWGRVVSIQADGGAPVTPPAGESPYYLLKLVPGKYTVTVENQATSGKGTIAIDIPAQKEGSLTLTAPDVKEGVRRLVGRDPYFSQNP